MPDLIHSLQGRDLGHLRIIAELWGLELDAPDARVALERLLPRLLDRELLGEVIGALPEMARAALLDLLQHDGRLSWSSFTRRYGLLREVGPARRDRERPYLSASASAAEALWYRGLIGRAFFDAPDGPEEFAFVPDDLAEVLPPVEPPERQPLGRPASPLERAFVLPASDRILDDATTLLAGLRLGLPGAEIASSMTCGLGTPFPLNVPQLHALLGAAGLLDASGFPAPEPVRAFLEASRADALSLLGRAWLRSPSFDELRLLPGIITEGEWQDDPLRARQAVLDFLSTVPGSQAVSGSRQERSFWSLPAFVAAVRQVYPDFQRPAGDYDSWYIRDAESGDSLRGFEHWEAVDGALVRFMIAGPLHWLGVLDLAAPAESEAQTLVTAFQFSAWSHDLLDQLAPAGLPAEENLLAVTSDGRLKAPSGVPRSARYQAARFSAWEGYRDGIHHYRLTPGSLERARQQGLRVEHLLLLLRRHARAVPPSLAQALQRWEANGSEARLEDLVVLRVKDPALLQTLRSSRAARFFGDPLGPTAIIVRAGAREKVLALLAEMGYLGEVVIG
ncbi:MAG: helicase-associated domain-containing protein [Chloroflexota bacterium]